jgi:hypothetical protein
LTERYDAVRLRLVERGYLKGPIERFVLREALAPGGAGRAIARSSAKAALLGAPLLGALLAAATLAANRPLLGARDAAVLWVYFGVLAAAALFVLDVAAATFAAAWSRRRGPVPGDALRAGLLVAVPLLAYLVLLRARGPARGGLLEDVLFLAGALAATSFAAWLAGLVSLAGIVGRTGDAPERTRRAAALVVGVLLPIAALLFLVPGSKGREGSVAPSAFTPPSATPPPFLLLAIDGLDGDLVEALEPRGAADRLLATIASGALFPKTRGARREPAEVWTTIMTGEPPESHGVRAAGLSQLPGVAAPLAPGSGPAAFEAALRFLLPSRTVPVSGAGRRVRTLWEITGLVGPTLEVGFWSSWPARGIAGDATGGYVVSDRVLAKLLAGATEDRDVEPASLFGRLAQEFPADRDALRVELTSRFTSMPEDVASLAWESLLIDGFAWRTALRLHQDPKVAYAFVYLPGLDILRTRLSATLPPGDAGAAVGARAIETYVQWLDETVVAPAAARGGRLAIVADPGRSAPASAEGFLAVSGGGAAAACVGPSIDDLDVAPTVLRALSLPQSREMTGSAPARCSVSEGSAPAPIATWGRRGASSPDAESAYDPEMVERLKSLGYLR